MATLLSIAERFHSLQGEGTWVGTPMYFVRLAGCNVGEAMRVPGRYMCHRYDGKDFICDTDYRHTESLTPAATLAECWEDHVCLTGGEPLVQPITGIEQWCEEHGKTLHVETSGTRWPADGLSDKTWLTVSPKYKWLPEVITRADEIKLLVDNTFDMAHLPWVLKSHPNVFLSPINHVVGEPHSSLTWRNTYNLELTLKLLKSHPEWRLSIQAHKYLNLR